MQDMPRNMVTCIWLNFIWFLCASEGVSALNSLLPHESFLEERVLAAQVNLAKSFHCRDRDSSKLMNVSTTDPSIFQVGFNGVSSFWAFDEIHILADSSIHRLYESEGSLKMSQLAELPDIAFSDQLAFIEVVEWRRILFILIAFKSGSCRLYTATNAMKITSRQTIYNFGPQDAEFFTHENELFLIVISSKPDSHMVPSYIYRWTGTHFDEIHTFITSGAVAVSTYLYKRAVIITVARYPTDNPKIGSQVFRWSHNGLEKMQILATNGPLALKFFEACGEIYLLVINDYEYSSVFWWAGREFVNWDSLYDVKGMNKISIGYIQDETLILIAENNQIKIYRPLGNKLHTLTTISLFAGEEIISMSLHDNGESRLIVISRKEGKLHTSVFQIHVVKGQIGDYNEQKPDQLLKCLLDLSEKLLAKGEIIRNLEDMLPNLLSVRKDLTLKGKLVVNGTVYLKDPRVRVMETNTNGKQLLKNVLQINDELKKTQNLASQTRQSIEYLVKKTTSRHITGEMNIQGNLSFISGKLNQMSVNKLNEKIFQYSNKLTYDKEQVIAGTVGMEKLKINKMNVNKLNGIPLEDLLLRNGNQTVKGYHKVKELKVNNIYMNREKSINDIDLNGLVYKNAQKVNGLKNITTLNAKKISVLLLNDENATSIEEKFVHTSGGKYTVEKLTFGSKLEIKDLHVEEINGINWEMFKSLVFLKGENQYINGTLEFVETMKTGHISTNYLNKILMKDIMTKTTDQDIFSSIKVHILKAKNINAELSNGLKLANDVAQIGKMNYINGFVKMDNVMIYNLTTDKNARWEGMPRPEEVKQVVVYNGPVTVIGNFQVENISLRQSTLRINNLDFDIWSIASKYWKFYEKEVRLGTINSKNLKIVGKLDLQKINGIKVKDIIHIISTEEIYGITFEDIKTTVINLKNASISGINVQYLNKTAVMKKGDHIVRGHKKFHGGLLGENVYADWIDNRNMAELVPLEAEHHSLGEKIFVNINLKKNVHVNDAKVDLLNDIELLSMVTSALRVDSSFTLRSIRFSTLIGDNIQATTINNVNFNNFVESLMMKTSTIRIKEVKINGDVEFLGNLKIENLNGIPLYPYLSEVLNKETGGYVRGKKEFKDATVNVLKAHAIDGVNMKYLAKYALLKTKMQNITGYFKMENVFTDNFITQKINGEYVVNAVFLKGNNLIEIQSNAIFSDLIIKGGLRVLKLNSCDITQAGEYLLGAIHFKSFNMLNVTQQMDWELPNTEANSLSNLFTKAVQKNDDNIIDGEVVFAEKVYTKWLITKGEINGVDLRMIAKDCVKKSSSEQELYGQKIFISSINASYVEVKGNANIKLVNGVDMIHINKTLVRKTEDKEIKGYKQFISGFEAKKVKCGGKVKGVSVSNIATIDDEILPPSEFQNLVINQNLDFETVNSIDLNQLMKKRVRCDDIGEITANLSFNGNVKIIGKAETSNINYINFNEIMLTESKIPQEILGKKEFQQSILIKGNLQISFVNSYNLEEAYRFGILANEDVTIDGNIVFTDLLTIENNLEVKYLINTFDLFSVYKNAMQEYERRIKAKGSYISKMEHQFVEHYKVIKGITTEFMFLEYENGFKMPELKAISASATAFTDKTLLSIHGQEECDLPYDCRCPIQYEVNITEEGSTWAILKKHKRQYRTYDSTAKLGAELFTNTISQNNKCKLQPQALKNEFNKIVWKAWNDDAEIMTDDLNTDTYIFEGYVSHISSIVIEDSFYLAIAIYYDAVKSSHNIESLILKWTPGESSANIFQHIPTFGAKVMEIFQTEIGVFLFVGNSYDSDFKTNVVNNEIYRLNDQKSKFTLLRSIQTTGTYSAKCFSIKDEYFIVISQQFGSPVVIMKYYEEYDNFYLYQKLYLKATTLGIGVFYVEGNNIIEAYLGIVVSDGSFHLYKYAYIEGFKKLMSQKQKGIQNFVPIYFGKNQLILTPSLFGNQMLSVVLQGPYY